MGVLPDKSLVYRVRRRHVWILDDLAALQMSLDGGAPLIVPKAVIVQQDRHLISILKPVSLYP